MSITRRVLAIPACLALVGSLLPAMKLEGRQPELPYCMPVPGTTPCSYYVDTGNCYVDGGVTYCRTWVFYWWTQGTPV